MCIRDRFCGTGAVGIEAYSRGAGKVVLNDVSRESVKLAKANLEKLGIADVEVKTSDALTLLDTVTEKFDYVFIDAPYADKTGELAVAKAIRVLKDGGEIIYENEKPLVECPKGLYVSDERKYGRAGLTFFRAE